MSAPVFKVLLPVKIVSVANKREHWGTRAKRAKAQRATAALLCKSARMIPLPITVTLTRIGGHAMDEDNLAGGFKAVRDGIADALGLVDNNPDIRWVYAQAKGKAGAAHVEIVGA